MSHFGYSSPNIASHYIFAVSTEIGHDSENKIKVDGFDGRLAYTHRVYYDASFQQIEALISISSSCKQHIKVGFCLQFAMFLFLDFI